MENFTPLAVKFLADLRANNDRAWFQANRQRAEDELMAPARHLVTRLGDLLRKTRKLIIADPRTDRSLYRLNRDTRFSRDKTPYKDHLGVWCWEGSQGRLECPGFYFHLTPDGWGFSVGCYRFSQTGLERWREAVLDARRGPALDRLGQDLEKKGLIFSPPELKRAPAGFDPAHSRIRWLRHKGLYTWNEEEGHPAELFSPNLAKFLMERFERGFKLHDWLVKNT